MKKYSFRATIYKTGINWCVDVPAEISQKLKAVKGFIRIKGDINGFPFSKSLVPVKNGPYRLYVNGLMMKGGKTALGETASFKISQDTRPPEVNYPVPAKLKAALSETGLSGFFNKLSASRKKDILSYLNNIKTEVTLERNIRKVISQLEIGKNDARIP